MPFLLVQLHSWWLTCIAGTISLCFVSYWHRTDQHNLPIHCLAYSIFKYTDTQVASLQGSVKTAFVKRAATAATAATAASGGR